MTSQMCGTNHIECDQLSVVPQHMMQWDEVRWGLSEEAGSEYGGFNTSGLAGDRVNRNSHRPLWLPTGPVCCGHKAHTARAHQPQASCFPQAGTDDL